MDRQVARQRLGQHWFITEYICKQKLPMRIDLWPRPTTVLLPACPQWWPRIRLYLLYCSLYSFFFHTLGLYTAPVTCSLFRPCYVFIANLQCTLQALQHFFFFSKFFHIGFTSRPVTKKQKSCWTQTRSGQHSIFIHFCPSEHLFLLLNPHGGFPVPFFFLEFPCSCLSCPFFRSFTKHVSFWQCQPTRNKE